MCKGTPVAVQSAVDVVMQVSWDVLTSSSPALALAGSAGTVTSSEHLQGWSGHFTASLFFLCSDGLSLVQPVLSHHHEPLSLLSQPFLVGDMFLSIISMTWVGLPPVPAMSASH